MRGLSAVTCAFIAAYAADLLRDPGAREHLMIRPFMRQLIKVEMALEAKGHRVLDLGVRFPGFRRRVLVMAVFPVLVLAGALAASTAGGDPVPVAAVAGALLAAYGLLDYPLLRARGLDWTGTALTLPALAGLYAIKLAMAAISVFLLLDGVHRANKTWPLAVVELFAALLVAGAAHLPAVWAERRSRAVVHARFGDEVDRRTLLYLRAFDDDGIKARTPVQTVGITRSLLPFRRVRFEESLAALLADNGELVTVGRPGEALPELGATRTYLPLDDWQDAVRDTAHRCGAIFLMAGTSSSLAWELEQLGSWGLLSKTLVLLPPDPDLARSTHRMNAVEKALGLRPIDDDEWLSPFWIAVGIDPDGNPRHYLSDGRDWGAYFATVTAFLAMTLGTAPRPPAGYVTEAIYGPDGPEIPGTPAEPLPSPTNAPTTMHPVDDDVAKANARTLEAFRRRPEPDGQPRSESPGD